MRMLADCHMHTYLCGHAFGEPEAFVRSAAAKGIDLVTFTCHVPMRDVDGFAGQGIRMSYDDLPRYRELVEEARAVGESVGVEVLYGIEGEYFPDESMLVEQWQLFEDESFDFVLCSLHHQLPLFREWLHRFESHEAIATAYFEQVANAAKTGKYDSIAHPDLIRIYNTIPPFAPETQETAIRRMLADVAESDTCLEVNTSGLIKQIFELHPAPQILSWAAEAGVRLTLGSDSHRPEQVGQHFPEVLELLSQLGFDKVHYFRGRKCLTYAI
jgi:histidinol-phosphatase (PHP family)